MERVKSWELVLTIGGFAAIIVTGFSGNLGSGLNPCGSVVTIYQLCQLCGLVKLSLQWASFLCSKMELVLGQFYSH